MEEGSPNSTCSVNVRDALVLLLAANTALRATSVFICTGSRKLKGEVRPNAELGLRAGVYGRGHRLVTKARPGLCRSQQKSGSLRAHQLAGMWTALRTVGQGPSLRSHGSQD